MLTKKDVRDIVADILGEFYEKSLAPSLDITHKEIQESFGRLEDKIDIIGEYIKDHEKRITKLEDLTLPKRN